MTAEVDPWAAWQGISLADPASLSDADRRLLAFGWLRTEINNGGFHQLFFNSTGDLVPDAIEAARDVGTGDLAELVERAITPLGLTYPRDRFARQETLEALGDDLFDYLDPLDEEYYALEVSSDLDAAMRSLVDHP